MTKEIKLETLAAFDEDYAKDPVAKVMRRALAKNGIDSIAYVEENEYRTIPAFSIEIPTMSACAQKQSGRCWLFAGMNVLREQVAKKCNLKEFELSQNYMAFYDKLEKINWTMESLIANKDADKDDRTLVWILQNAVQDGGQWDMVVSLVKKYGIVPKQVMNETFTSSSTRYMNQLINQRLRKFNAVMRKLPDDQVAAYKESTLKELYSLCCTCFGLPPKTFDFEYTDKDGVYHLVKDLTPITFRDQFLDMNLDDYVSVVHAPTDDKPFYHTFTVDYIGNVVGGNPVTYLNLPIEEVKALTIAQMKDNEVVWFGSDCGKYGDRANGLWDPAAFDFNTAFGIDFTMTKEEMMDNRHSAMNHAMVLTGVNLVNEKSTRWKIENSWGVEAGRKGYYCCSDEWFDLLVYQVVINKKYLNDAQKAALATEPIHLHPWDPMGTLAD